MFKINKIKKKKTNQNTTLERRREERSKNKKPKTIKVQLCYIYKGKILILLFESIISMSLEAQ